MQIHEWRGWSEKDKVTWSEMQMKLWWLAEVEQIQSRPDRLSKMDVFNTVPLLCVFPYCTIP